MPRIAYMPTDEHRAIVKAMASYGVPQEDIGKVLKLSHVTLRKYYRDELEVSAIMANSKIAETLFGMAKDGKNPAATFFWLKCRAGWKETQRIENRDVDKDGDDKDLNIVVKYVNKPIPE